MKKTSSMKFLTATFLIFTGLVLADTVWCYEVTVFDPKTYTRGNGKPQVISDTFSVPERVADFHLLITNGANGKNRVSSAIVRINDIQILGPSDFNQKVDTISKPIALTGTNKLQVELRSAPGSFIILKILGNLQNSPPGTNAGPDQAISEGDMVTLDGSTSSDPDSDPLTFAWSFSSKPAGSQASLSDPTTVNPTFVADLPGIYEIQLIVSDGYEFSSADVVQITARKKGVQFTLGDGSVSLEITPEGGTLTTQGADGTKFTLTIPPGALLNPEVITLTPIVSVTGLPLNSEILAPVHLAPSGLKFGTPATLTVEFPSPPSIQRLLMGFLFQDDGLDFHLIPATLYAKVATLQIDHFTGAGFVEPTDEEVLDFALNEYYGIGGLRDALRGLNSCEGESLNNAIKKTLNFRKLADLVGDRITFNPRPCIYPDPGPEEEWCSDIAQLADAGRQSLEDVIKIIFVQLDNQCKTDPSKEAETLKCIAVAQNYSILFPDDLLEFTLQEMKTCGLSSLEIRPGKTCLIKGESATWEVIALDAWGNQLSGRTMRWGSTQPSVAGGSTSGDTAIVTGINYGSAYINVIDEMSGDLGVNSSGFNRDEVGVTVVKPNVSVMPDSRCILVGQAISLTATVTDCFGNPYTGCTVAWYSNNVGVAGVDASGLVIGNAEGDANISAVCGDGIGFAGIKVIKPKVTVTPSQASIAVCNPIQLAATVKDYQGNPYTGCTLAWYSSNIDVAGVDASGLVTPKHRGQVNISAVCGDSIGVATITVKGFTGVWDTRWETVLQQGPNTPMTITFSSVGDATGTYYSDSWAPLCPGRVDGTIDGQTSDQGCKLAGRWTDNGAYSTYSCNVIESGRFEFHLSPGGDSFTGTFWYPHLCDVGAVPCGGSWNGVRRPPSP